MFDEFVIVDDEKSIEEYEQEISELQDEIDELKNEIGMERYARKMIWNDAKDMAKILDYISKDEEHPDYLKEVAKKVGVVIEDDENE